MRKLSLSLLMFFAVACAPQAKPVDFSATQSSQPVIPTPALDSTNAPIEYRLASSRALAVWSMQCSKSFTPSISYADYRDLAGKNLSLTNGASIMISAKPILIETMPVP
ncbi:MAG: hypothetical protein WBW94_04690 [Anaerolineales bacterium]